MRFLFIAIFLAACSKSPDVAPIAPAGSAFSVQGKAISIEAKKK